jgi:hypothetical protein
MPEFPWPRKGPLLALGKRRPAKDLRQPHYVATLLYWNYEYIIRLQTFYTRCVRILITKKLWIDSAAGILD